LNIKTFIQMGDHTDRIEIIIDQLTGSNYNDVVYNFDSEGLFISVYNQSAVYFMPDVLITDSFDDDDASDDDKAFSNFESQLTVIASVDYPRSVTIFDSGVIYGDGISLIAQKLIRHPERLFATIDDDGTTQLSDSRVLLSSLEGLSRTASSKSGSVLTTTSTSVNNNNNNNENVARDLHADFAASAAKADEHASTTPVAAAAGAVAMFAGLAIASRKRRGAPDGKKKKQKKQAAVTNSSAAGYTSLD
jgi:hypothetical protein